MKNEWVDAMKGGGNAMSSFDYASQMEAALKVDGKIEWDSTDISDLIQREYRPG